MFRLSPVLLSFITVSALTTLTTAAHAQILQPPTRPAAEMRLPGLRSTSGLLETPTAYVQRNAEVTAFAAGEHTASGGLLAGLANRLELGFAVGEKNAGVTKTPGSAKLNIFSETLVTPAISVGVLDAFRTSPEGTSGYAVVSKTFAPYFLESVLKVPRLSVKAHAGYGTGLYKNRPFVGAELWGSGPLGLLAESSAGHFNVGARFYSHGIGATLGYLETKRVGGSVSYTISLL